MLVRLADGFPDLRMLEDLHEVYGVNHSGLRILLTPFCRNQRIAQIPNSLSNDGGKIGFEPQLGASDLTSNWDGTDEGYVECLVSGNVFSFGSRYEISSNQENQIITNNLEKSECD